LKGGGVKAPNLHLLKQKVMKLRVLGDVHFAGTKEITWKKDEIVTLIDWEKDIVKNGVEQKKGLWLVFKENPEIITHQEWFRTIDEIDDLDLTIELKRIKEQYERK
jgi:hypothetical protein